jgi:hypothetical protein
MTYLGGDSFTIYLHNSILQHLFESNLNIFSTFKIKNKKLYIYFKISFDGKDYSYSCLFVCVKFHKKNSVKKYFIVFFYNCNVVPKMLQTKNVLWLIIELFICASISYHNGRLWCKPTLIENFHCKRFSQYLPWCIKFKQVLKITTL